MQKTTKLPPADELKKQVEAYFAACDATAERTPLKNGAAAYRQVPYTFCGLAAHIHMDRAQILRCVENPVRSHNGKAVCEILKDAIRRIEQHVTERALLGELNATVAAMLLKDIGGGEEREDSAAALTVTMDDREDWSQ